MTRWLSLTCLTVLAFAQATGPLASFESDADQPFAASGARLRRVAEHATAGQSALEVVFPGSEKDSWPGIILRPGANRDWSQRDLLVFDAFLAGTEPVRLGVRLDSDGAEGAFDAIDLRPGLQRGVKVSLKGFSATANLKVVKQLLLYVGKPRQDITVWLDNVRWDTAAAQLARIVHVETRPTPAPTVDQVKCGFMLFARSYLAMVFPDDRPTGPISRLELVAARGEREPVSLSVYALHDLAATISISNLAGPHGAKLPATAWDIRRVECLAKRLGYSSDQYVTDVPSYLAPADGLTAIGADRTRTFQLTLAAPPDAVPGVYVGRVTVQAGDLAQAVPLRVRILPYNLPEPTGLLYGEYYRKFGRYTQTAEDFRRDLADMRAQGMTSLGLCVGIDPKSYTVSGDQVTFHWTGDTAFEWIMQAYVEQGFPAPVVMLSDSGQEAAAAGGGEPGQARYDAAYLHFHQALAAALKAKGWPELYIQPVDEASWQSVADQQRNLHLLGLLHRNGIKTEVDGPPDKYLHELAGPLSDIWTCNGRIGPQEVVDAARAAGRLVTNYNNDVESWTPEADRWAYGLFNWCHGLNGGFNWAYRTGSRDLYNNLDAESGDWVHNFPPEPGRPGGPSTGWEGAREGVTDRRYLRLLESLLAKAPAGEAKAAAEAFLTTLRSRLDPRLNYEQAMELALALGQLMAQERLPGGR